MVDAISRPARQPVRLKKTVGEMPDNETSLDLHGKRPYSRYKGRHRSDERWIETRAGFIAMGVAAAIEVTIIVWGCVIIWRALNQP